MKTRFEHLWMAVWIALGVVVTIGYVLISGGGHVLKAMGWWPW